MMIDVILIIFFGYMAIRIFRAVQKENEIFKEFNQSKTFAWLALLFPFGPIVYLVTVFRLGWLIAIVLMAACYIPSLITSRKQIKIFEYAGTDRVKNAHNAATQAFGTAIGGLVYTAISLLFSLMNTAHA